MFFKHYYSPDQHASVHLDIVVTNSTIQPVKIIVPADKTSTGLQFVKSGTVSCDILGGYIDKFEIVHKNMLLVVCPLVSNDELRCISSSMGITVTLITKTRFNIYL